MRIITLRAENFKRLRAIEVTPDGNMVVIAGKNAVGKSSVLDAIWAALAGAAGVKETSRPIRDGEKQASVTLDMGDLIVHRRWTEAGTTLEVAAKDGARYPSPQTVLDGLVGRLSFDPLAFANQPPKDQLATLLSVVELPFDPEELARKRLGVYDARTDVNREAKRVEALVSGLPEAPEGTPDVEVSAAELSTELADAIALNQQRIVLGNKVADLADEILRLQTLLDGITATHAEAVATLDAFADPVDPGPLREKLSQADVTNAAVRGKQEKEKLSTEAARLAAESVALTAELEKIDRRKEQAIAEAKMPLEGLGFDDEGVLYQGVPFSQASASERLRVGIAMAMALNPEIRVIRITDGSLLDSENLKLIDEMAAAHDYQLWIERVDETGKIGIVIEDGQVAGQVIAPEPEEPQ